MFIYQHLEIENHEVISNSIKNYIENKTNTLEEKLPWKFLDIASLLEDVPELNTVFEIWNLQIIMAAAIYRRPYSQGGIHIDSSHFYRVVWPVINCQGSKTKFFKPDLKKFKPGSGKEGDQNLSLISGNKLEFLGEFELISPVIFNPKIPHGVYCDPLSNEHRVSVTFGFDRDPRHVFCMERSGESNLRL